LLWNRDSESAESLVPKRQCPLLRPDIRVFQRQDNGLTLGSLGLHVTTICHQHLSSPAKLGRVQRTQTRPNAKDKQSGYRKFFVFET